MVPRAAESDVPVLSTGETCCGKGGWPGEIRQLENVLGRMTLISTTGRLEIDRPPLDRQFGDHARPARKGMCEAFANGHALEDIERAALEAALEKSGGNRKRAARVLGVSLRTIYNMIDRFGLPKRQAGSSESRASRG